MKLNKKYGIINKSGKLVLHYEYDEIAEFKEGKASVSKGDKYSYIDKLLNLVIPINYSKLGDF